MMKMTPFEVPHCLMYSDPKPDLSYNEEVFSTEIYHVFTIIQHCCEHHGYMNVEGIRKYADGRR